MSSPLSHILTELFMLTLEEKIDRQCFPFKCDLLSKEDVDDIFLIFNGVRDELKQMSSIMFILI